MSHRLIYYRVQRDMTPGEGRREVDSKFYTPDDLVVSENDSSVLKSLMDNSGANEEAKAALEDGFRRRQEAQARVVRDALSQVPEIARLKRAMGPIGLRKLLERGRNEAFFRPDEAESGLTEITEATLNAQVSSAIPEFNPGTFKPNLTVGLPKESPGNLAEAISEALEPEGPEEKLKLGDDALRDISDAIDFLDSESPPPPPPFASKDQKAA